ncbi:type II secretion system F family protein [Candidatus Pacearchaeota archaeon]|nr:type II secretion system F family protein [Candidatus Pacearchaeota archaeon]
MNEQDYLPELRKTVEKEIKIIKEIAELFRNSEKSSPEERKMVNSHIDSLKGLLRRTGDEVSSIVEDMAMLRPLQSSIESIPLEHPNIPPTVKLKKIKAKIVKAPEPSPYSKGFAKQIGITELERKIVKRLKKKEAVKTKRSEKKASRYVSTATKIFGNTAAKLDSRQIFMTMRRDLLQANLEFIPKTYISLIFFTTMIAAIVALFIFVFLLFFSLSVEWPILRDAVEGIGARAMKTFWVLFAIPLATFLIMYIYPSLEKRHRGNKIDQELPFATIHMAAIAGSLVEPSKMFNILISTKEYPYLEKELTKLINEINVYGYDLMTALRNTAFNSPSQRLGEVFNGLATTINSGGSLEEFFDKRAQGLLFDYRLERERYAKTAETFMDIYISLVIAAPMILMLLLIMMKISGLGISLSTSAITLIMILGVAAINAVFLVFLQLKQPSG